MRLVFQDGTEWDISADVEFAGLSEEDFRAALLRSQKLKRNSVASMFHLRSTANSGKMTAKCNHRMTPQISIDSNAQRFWHILSEGSLYDGDRLFVTVKPAAAPCANKPFGRASLSQAKGLNSKNHID